jgi:hypothetical protein
MKPSRSQSIALSVLACVVAFQMSSSLAAGAGVESTGPKTLTLTKDCTPVADPGELPYCLVTASNYRALRGAKIRYFGPGFYTADHPYIDSWVVIEGVNGTAFGHCLVRTVPAVLGACQFTGGSGSLKGFKADVTVTSVDFATWYWNGTASTGN